jgi:hypothetical protein
VVKGLFEPVHGMHQIQILTRTVISCIVHNYVDSSRLVSWYLESSSSSGEEQ